LKWIKRLAKGAGVLVLFTLLAGIGYEQWARWNVSRTFPPPGVLYEVDDRLSHLQCSGEGAPTVVLEAGLDVGGSVSWSGIYPDLAESGRVCAYDRAGIMWSQGRRSPRDAANIADELHSLLDVASETPPYVMVGHSLGGLLIRVFDDRFPGEVAGFVFVDASHPEQVERLPPEWAEAGTPSPLLIRTLSTLGVLRLTSPSSGPEALPPQSGEALSAFTPRSLQGAMREMDAIDLILGQARATGPLGDRPVVVLTAARQPDPLPPGLSEDTWNRMQAVWPELQAELAALSTNSDHRVFPNATHYVHWDEPAAVVTAVRDVVTAAREGGSVRADNR